MSNNDSFIDEVSAEVRRDRLFGYVRRYGWIAATVIVVLVGGAAVNEWLKARDRAEAEALGGNLLEALALDAPEERLEALSQVDPDGAARAVAGLIAAAESIAADDDEAAALRLEALAVDPELPPRYTELARLKLSVLTAADTPPEERIGALSPLARAGGPYRLLAEEQIALAEVEAGRTDEAIERLRVILAEQGVSADLRRRVTQLIVALGGDLDAT